VGKGAGSGSHLIQVHRLKQRGVAKFLGLNHIEILRRLRRLLHEILVCGMQERKGFAHDVLELGIELVDIWCFEQVLVAAVFVTVVQANRALALKVAGVLRGNSCAVVTSEQIDVVEGPVLAVIPRRVERARKTRLRNCILNESKRDSTNDRIDGSDNDVVDGVVGGPGDDLDDLLDQKTKDVPSFALLLRRGQVVNPGRLEKQDDVAKARPES
jgi:hypothetical protein